MTSTRTGNEREGGRAPVPGARRLASEAPPWIKTMARIGVAAKGLVYVVVGMLAARAAMGDGGEAPGDVRSALTTILAQPFGRALLGITAVGLLAYALWLLLGAATDADRKGDDWKGIAARVSGAVRGILHGLIAWQAGRLAMDGVGAGGGGGGGGGGGDGERAEQLTQQGLQLPFGEWLVGLVALGLAGYAVYQLYVAFSDKVKEDLDLHELSHGAAQAAVWFGRLGIAARAVVFGGIAWLVMRAALTARAEEAGGLQESLREIQTGTGVPLLFSFVAAGLIAYGLFQFVRARYRRMRI